MNRALGAATAALALLSCGPATSSPAGPGVPPGGRIYPIAPPAPEFLVVPAVPAIPGFSSAVKVGQAIYLAGQVPMDSTGLLVGPGDRAAQFRQALANAAAIVRYARGVPADLIKLTVYCVGCGTADWDAMRGAAAEVFPSGQGPALTALGIASLPGPDLLVAVDGVAVLRGTIPDRTRDSQSGTQ